MKKLILFYVSLLWCFVSYAQSNSAIFLHHSTGGNVYNEGNVASWIANYNSSHGTNYSITERAYPNSPWPWSNYPYDYWKLWIDGSCDNSDEDIECLASIASQYELVIFKHCYPGSDVLADLGTPDVSSSRKSLENYKIQYRALRDLMDGMPNTKFMIWTLAPRHRLATNTSNAYRAHQFVNWVNNDFLTEDGNGHPNIYIFDFNSIVTEYQSNPSQGVQYCLKYIYEKSHTSSDSHPNTTANQTAGPIFAQAIVDALADDTPPELTITTSSIPAATAGEYYSTTLSATGGTVPYTWDEVGTNLPSGISLSADGIISGTTSNTGTYIFTAGVEDSENETDQKQFTLSVNEASIYIDSIILVDPIGDTAISKLNNGDEINLAELPNPQLTIVAVASNSDVKSATFNMTGALTHQKTESIRPYALFGDNPQYDYIDDWSPVVGSYSLVINVYDATGGGGNILETKTINFHIIESEDFNDGIANDWSVLSGTWTVSGNQYQQSSTSGRCVACYANGIPWTDYIYSAGVQSAADVGITFRGNIDTQNYYVYRIHNTSTLELAKVTGGSWGSLGTYSYSTTAGQFYTLTAKVEGSSITLKIDGDPVTTYTGASFASGTVGLYTYNHAGTFDNVLVSEYSPTYMLTVNSGSGSDDYRAGTIVTISADTPPTGLEFDRWTSGTKNTKSFINEGSLANTEIMVCPNPTNGQLTISGMEGMAAIEIYTLSGTKVYQSTDDIILPYSMDISYYHPGIYIVKVTANGDSFMRKVMKE